MHQGNETVFESLQVLLNHDPAALLGKCRIQCLQRGIQVHCHRDAFSGFQAVFLDDDRGTLLLHPGTGRFHRVEGAVGSGWNVVFFHDPLGKILGGLHLGCSLCGAKHADSRLSQGICHACCQCRLRADDRKVDPFLYRKSRHGLNITVTHGHDCTQPGHTRIARGAEQLRALL